MLNLNENFVLINGQCRTSEIESIQYQNRTGVYTVIFKNSSKQYCYRKNKIHWLKNPAVLEPKNYQVRHNGFLCENIKTLLQFSLYFKCYYHIEYVSGTIADYDGSEIELTESCFNDEKSKNVFDYLKEVAKINSLATDDGLKILEYQYESVDFISKKSAIAPYLHPEEQSIAKRSSDHLIFPFGCNNSQIRAVRNAFDSQISVIQGPPGTGKTQTILNIIANIQLQGKTVLVVSNNNSAVDNVLEKLSKYEMGFIVAPLGSGDNKANFVDSQKDGRKYPSSLSSWECKEARSRNFVIGIDDCVETIKKLYSTQERIALLRQELSALSIEWNHFKNEVGILEDFELTISSSMALRLLNEKLDDIVENGGIWNRLRKWFKKLLFRYYYKIETSLLDDSGDVDGLLNNLRNVFYIRKQAELKAEITQLESDLAQADLGKLTQSLEENSMKRLKDFLYVKYSNKHEAYTVTKDSFYGEPLKVLEEFPVILSTTFSARSSLRHVEYDYLIMDEASQVSVETGALALSCAKNAIIVGDTLQLPNIVTSEDAEKLSILAHNYHVDEGYHSESRSFLQSIMEVIPSIPETLLREHYRCAPSIIDFCNRKFYGGQLVIMTKQEGDKMPIVAIKTAKGIHSHNHYNQREVEVICKELLPQLDYDKKEIGIIAPYNRQVDMIKSVVDTNIEVATVHKFQGREKDAIIMSVVDDQFSVFVDDPNLLNVAVSRAKKLFCLVASGNEQAREGNVVDLLRYIEYNNGEVIDSRIHSIYDMLYKQNEKVRADYLREHKRISEYDSENLTHVLISDILSKKSKYSCLDVLCHYPLSLLINDFSPLTDEEKLYASNRLTHLDFLIYNRLSKRPLLAIEVDGWTYHQEGTEQARRDKLKNHILSVYGLRLIRLSTTGSGEYDIIESELSKINGLGKADD